MKNHTKIRTWLLICSLTLLLHACSTPFMASKDDFEVVDRTKPASAPWKFTRTPDLSLTATSQYLVTATQLALEAQATQAAQATATAEVFAIQSTATALARESAIMAYEHFDPFDQNTLNWRVGVEDNPYWQGSTNIEDGFYIWEITAVKETFFTWSDFTPIYDIEDFDVALRVRRVQGEPHQACFGLLFRQSASGIDGGTYILSVCDNGYFKVLYYEVENGLDVLQDWTPTEALHSGEWNLLEISARGEDFTIYINHLQVLTFKDSRLPSGKISILIDHFSETPSLIAFDFFALQQQ